MKTFRQFLLEKVSPTITSYGTNLSNNEWLKLEMRYTKKFKKDLIPTFINSTFFKHGNLFYQVVFTKLNGKTHVAFQASKEFDEKIITSWDLEAKENYIATHFSFNLIRSFQAQSVFNKVLYVILEGCEQFGISYFRFEAADPSDESLPKKLSDFYERMFLKDGNINELEKHRLVFVGKENEVFLLKYKKGA
jgi:hypothetical protein